MTFPGKLALILILTSQTLKVNAAPLKDRNQNLQEGENPGNTCAFLTSVEPNKIRSVEYGGCVILNCTFKEAVECAWMSETTVEVQDRYSYLEENGKNTEVCSLKIEDFQQHDENTWKCFSMATDHHPGSAGTVFSLKGKPKPPKIEQNDTHSSFQCLTENTYKLPTQLYWLRNGEKVTSTMTPNITKNGVSYSAITLETETAVESLSCTAVYDDDSVVQSPTIISSSFTKGNNQYSQTTIIIAASVSSAIGIAIGLGIATFLRRKEATLTKENVPILPQNDGTKITSENDKNSIKTKLISLLSVHPGWKDVPS